MLVKDFQEQLKLAKNKDAKIIFKVGNDEVTLELMAEVVSDSKGIHFPSLGETTNAVAIKFATIPVTATKVSE